MQARAKITGYRVVWDDGKRHERFSTKAAAMAAAEMRAPAEVRRIKVNRQGTQYEPIVATLVQADNPSSPEYLASVCGDEYMHEQLDSEREE